MSEQHTTPQSHIKELRRALADYMRAEGCSCCRDRDEHAEAAERLGELLRVPRHTNRSGRNFGRYVTKRGDGGSTR